MVETCGRCHRDLPVVPDVTQNNMEYSPLISFHVSHVCTVGETIYFQSISFLTTCVSAQARAERIWADDSLWDLADESPKEPYVDCQECGQETSNVTYVRHMDAWVCDDCYTGGVCHV